MVLEGVLRVDLRHNQRHILAQAEGRGIVNKHRAAILNGGRKTLGHFIADRAQHDVHAGKGGFRRLLNGQRFAAKRKLLSRAARAGQRQQPLHREIALLQHLHHLLSHRARCAQHRYIIFFHALLPPSCIKPS